MVEREASVIPSQLVNARISLGLKPNEVADALGINEKQLIDWEHGVSELTLESLWSLAEFYKRSTDYFLRPLPALPEHLSFRLERHKVIQELPPQVREIIVRFEELCRAEYEIESALNMRRQVLIEKVNHDYTADRLADKERVRLGLKANPIKDLRKLLMKQGIRIFTLPIPDIPASELSGLSWWHDTYGPCVLLNGRNVSGRRLFTLAHEYAHLLQADPPTICSYMSNMPEERFANSFAAAFLMPSMSVRNTYLEIVGPVGMVPDDRDLGKLANLFRVSLEAMCRRLEILELIPRGTTDTKIVEWEKRPAFYKGRKGPKWRRQLGEEFVSLAIEAHSSGHLSTSKLAQYFGLDIRKTSEVLRESSASSTK